VHPSDYCQSLNFSLGSNESVSSDILKTHHSQIHSLQHYDKAKFYDSVIYSKLKYSFYSPTLFVETVNIKARQPSMVDAAVNRHIKKLDLYEEGFNFCYSILSFDGKTADVNVFALASEETKTILENIPHEEKPVSCVVPLEYLIVELLNDTGDNPVVSVWIEHFQVMMLVTQGKEVISRAVFEYPEKESKTEDKEKEKKEKEKKEKEIVQWLINSKHIQNTLETVKRQTPDKEVSLLIWGDSYKLLQDTLDQHLDLKTDKNLAIQINNKFVWKTHLDSSSQAQNKSNKSPQSFADDIDAIFSKPSLFGLAICQKSQTFISMDYEAMYSKFMHTRYALISCLMVFFVFSALNLQSFLVQLDSEDTLFQKISTLEAGIERIKPRIPDATRLSSVLEKTKFKISMDSELNVKKFLGWLTDISPKKAIIDQFSVEAKPALLTKAKNTNNGQKQFEVKLRMILNRAYFSSVTQTDIFFEKLNERVRSPQSKFIYLNETDDVPSELQLSFSVDPMMFY